MQTMGNEGIVVHKASIIKTKSKERIFGLSAGSVSTCQYPLDMSIVKKTEPQTVHPNYHQLQEEDGRQ